jgi:hypothetical protein
VSGGYYTIVAKAIVVLQQYIPVTFNVRAYVKTLDLTPNTYAAPKNVRGSLFLSEYAGFKFTLPTTANIGNWLDIEIYVDYDLQDRIPGMSRYSSDCHSVFAVSLLLLFVLFCSGLTFCYF